MNMGLEASMDILESAWSAWMQTYWIQTDMSKIFDSSIHSAESWKFLEARSAKMLAR